MHCCHLAHTRPGGQVHFLIGSNYKYLALALVIAAVSASILLGFAAHHWMGMPGTVGHITTLTICSLVLASSIISLAVTLVLRSHKQNRRQQDFNYAAQLGRLDEMAELINQGVDIHAGDSYFKRTPLHEAAKGGDAQAVDLLISSGADVTRCDRDGRTPLHCATTREAVYRLVKQGKADVYARDDGGETPILTAENPEVIEALVELGADINAADQYRYTALHRHTSAWQGFESNIPLLETLLKCGADIERKNHVDQTPLLVALERQDYRTAHFFLEKGAQQDVRDSLRMSAQDYILSDFKHLETCRGCQFPHLHRPKLHLMVKVGWVVPTERITEVIEANKKRVFP